MTWLQILKYNVDIERIPIRYIYYVHKFPINGC